MNYSSTSVAGWMLCQSQRGGEANRETGNDDKQFLEDRAANQGRHILTLLTDCADRADSLLTSVIPQPPIFYFLARAANGSITAAREGRSESRSQATRKQFSPAPPSDHCSKISLVLKKSPSWCLRGQQQQGYPLDDNLPDVVAKLIQCQEGETAARHQRPVPIAEETVEASSADQSASVDPL